MNLGAAVIFVLILVLGLFVNKYVLTVLGFKYPTIFQGWQTLGGLLLFKILTVASKSNFKVTPIDRSAFISMLPGFLFFTTSIIANSKALSGTPIPIFVSVYNVLPAAIYALDRILPGPQVGLDFYDSSYFWLVTGVVTSGVYCLHCRIADARYSSWDRLYYNSLLAPGGSCLHARGQTQAGRVLRPAHALAAVLSPLLFPAELAVWQWVLVITNVLAGLPMPSHLAKDDEETNFPSIMVDI